MNAIKPIYKVVRSIILSVIMLLAVVYIGLYVLLSIPTVQDKVKTLVCNELSPLLGGRLEIRNLTITPFNEVLLNDVALKSPQGEDVAKIRKVAAGIDLWKLVSDRRIVLNYAEVIGLDAQLSQKEKDGPLNIQFLIDALKPKDKNKPPTKFDLSLRNVIVRDSKANFKREWLNSENGEVNKFSDISLSNLRLDVSIPKLSNDLFRFDVRNLQFDVDPGVELRRLSAEIIYKKGEAPGKKDEIEVRNLNFELPHSKLEFEDLAINLGFSQPFNTAVRGYVNPKDFSSFSSSLEQFDTRWNLDLDASLSKNDIELNRFNLENESSNSYIHLTGSAENFQKKDSIQIDLKDLKANITQRLLTAIFKSAGGRLDKVRRYAGNLGDIYVEAKGEMSNSDKANASGLIELLDGGIEFDANAKALRSRRPHINANIDVEDLPIGELLGVELLGRTSFSLVADVAGMDKNAQGEIELNADYVTINDNRFSDISSYVKKTDDHIYAAFYANDTDLQFRMEGDYNIDGAASTLDAYIDMSGVNTYLLGVKGKFGDSLLGFDLDLHTVGNNADNLTGFLQLSDFDLLNLNGKMLHLNQLALNIDPIGSRDMESEELPSRTLKLRSDWVDANAIGKIFPLSLTKQILQMVASVFPSLMPSVNALSAEETTAINNFEFDMNIKGKPDLYEYLDLPICPLSDIPVKGSMNANGKLTLDMSTQHLRQGKNKLLRDLMLSVDMNSLLGMAKIGATVIYPTKKGDVQLAVDLSGVHDVVNTNLSLNPTFDSVVKGGLSFNTAFSRMPDPMDEEQQLAVHVDIIPSTVTVKDMVWNVANGSIDYFGNNVEVKNFLINHDNQYVKINGVASNDPDEYLTVKLNDIDLEYIFNILNINYVTFGGMATGEVVGSRLLTKSPVAFTKFLRVKNMSYNGAELGNGDLASSYHADEQRISIYAVISDALTREKRVNVDGGIWLKRDSLSFAFDANKVNLQLMKPFVSAFCSDLYGTGSGKCKLFGTFKDIDLVGDVCADTISMKIDFTNTWYHAGRDTVFLDKGLIEIPPLTLYDRDGNTAELSGWMHHSGFHDPVFDFRLKDAKSILCYDTNEKLNPMWYGTIYATGNAQISGRPGLVEIEMNMATNENSKFFYVINDAEDTGNYTMLSFTDRRKEHQESLAKDSIPEYLHQFMKKAKEEDESRSNVVLSLKGSVTNDALVTLVMDPVSGDKITARGQGALQMDYNMDTNDLRMMGTYEIEEGSYYFTLQDIIIKNFNIKEGSRIKFDGNPMDANLDIAATYRVNTNLTDLDESFATDKELTRTNVPVDAILLVNGPMTHPEIDFNIELPTLTSDVERKVKSIVSTNDMMSRQIIYLLALNRFYTPEYTGSTSSGSGAEWSSMASSTLSSQLSNILSNMTDKLSVAPSFRSDKGDFTDMEFDLALSSRLLNNRLLINGNFGYRDRQTSNTQFVGDFDIEYLLNKNGYLRLKAYNHFNDQNYYLRSALTTQGVGLVYRRDFDNIFGLRRKRNSLLPSDLLIKEENKDSIHQNEDDIDKSVIQVNDSIKTD